MENILHDKITQLHEHLSGLEEVMEQYRQMRQSLLESEARFRLLIEHIKDYAIFMLSPEGYITSWNPGAARIKGYQAAEIIGRHFSVFYGLTERQSGKPARALAIARREGRYLDEGWRLRKDGSQFWASVVITAIYDQSGQVLGFGKITRDLTEQKHYEDMLARQYEAQEAIRMRDAFLSVAAHELKTPITNLQGFAQVTLRHIEKAATIDTARVVRALRVIDTQADKLAQLVRQLLDVAQLQSGHGSLSAGRVNLSALTQQMIALIEVQTTRHTFVVHAPASVTVEADALRLEQVLANVLENAVKYSPGGGEIAVTIAEPEDGQVRIVISDQGIGIPEEERERIFDPFYRIYHDMEHVAAGGVGLGLFVSRQIIAMHNGEITAEARPGGGSRFVITLPARAGAERQQPGEILP